MCHSDTSLGRANRSCPSSSHTWDRSYFCGASSASPTTYMSTWGPSSAFGPIPPPEARSASKPHAPDTCADENHHQLPPLLPFTPSGPLHSCLQTGQAMPHPELSMAPYDFHDHVFFPIFGPCDFYHLVLKLLFSLLLNFRIICTYCGKFLASQEHTV